MKRAMILAALLLAGNAANSVAAEPSHARLPQAESLAKVELPSPSEQVQLVDNTMALFVKGLKAKSFEEFYDQVSIPFKKNVTLQSLDETMKKGFSHLKITGDPFGGIAPVFTENPKMTSPLSFAITGYYPTTPVQLAFEMTYIREGLQWKLIHIRIAPRPAVTT